MRKRYDAMQVNYRIEYRDTFSVVQENTPAGKAHCALCSRMRRGILYRIAGELKANKIALGHHRDDFIETLLLNQFMRADSIDGEAAGDRRRALKSSDLWYTLPKAI